MKSEWCQEILNLQEVWKGRGHGHSQRSETNPSEHYPGETGLGRQVVCGPPLQEFSISLQAIKKRSFSLAHTL